jgi:hypothetical protein
MEPLVTADDLRTYMQRPVRDDVADLAVLAASATVRTHCAWNLSREATTFTLNGNNTRILNLPTLNLISVDSVVIDTVPATGWTSSLRGQLYRAVPWPDFRRIDVACVHGYEPIPDVVKVVSLAIAARQVDNPMRFKTAAVGSVNRTFDITGLDQLLLHPFTLFPTA